MADEPRIIVDDDWKSQAQAEKERLAKEAEARKQESEEESKPGSFDDLVKMLVTQALMYMGAYPDPQTGKAMIALDLAKLNIDFLAVLEEKTRDNLTEEEAKMLNGELIHALRLQFVDIQKEVAKAIEDGRLQQSPDQGGLGGMPPSNTPGV